MKNIKSFLTQEVDEKKLPRIVRSGSRGFVTGFAALVIIFGLLTLLIHLIYPPFPAAPEVVILGIIAAILIPIAWGD